MIVRIIPIGCRPGINRRAIAPATRPKTIQPKICTALPSKTEMVERPVYGLKNNMHSRTAREEANCRPLATRLARRYDGADVEGNDRLRAGSSFPEGHRGATET